MVSMRELLTQHIKNRVYLFTTQGHVISGTLEVIEELVTLRAPDGITLVQVNLTDVSGVRLYTEENEDAS
ncbi:Hypothetical protein A7982_01034 [Minicystis rosea]|nr:Hypothetical protein A7982_01034 [Minicystis rosea]